MALAACAVLPLRSRQYRITTHKSSVRGLVRRGRAPVVRRPRVPYLARAVVDRASSAVHVYFVATLVVSCVFVCVFLFLSVALEVHLTSVKSPPRRQHTAHDGEDRFEYKSRQIDRVTMVSCNLWNIFTFTFTFTNLREYFANSLLACSSALLEV